MPVLREQIVVPQGPVLRLTTPDGEEETRLSTEDAFSAALGMKVSASLYEVWAARDLWHMAGGQARPIATLSQTVGREVAGAEFSAAVARAVNEMLGYDGCRTLGKDRIRADGSETVAAIVDGLLDKRRGGRVRKSVVASLRGE